jgi:hypothetical protein
MVRPGMLRDILAELLEAQDDMERVEAGGGDGAGEGGPPHVVILSVGSGTQAGAARAFLRRFPDCRVLMLAGESCSASLHELRPHESPVGELSPRRLLQIIRSAGAAALPHGGGPCP